MSVNNDVTLYPSIVKKKNPPSAQFDIASPKTQINSFAFPVIPVCIVSFFGLDFTTRSILTALSWGLLSSRDLEGVIVSDCSSRSP